MIYWAQCVRATKLILAALKCINPLDALYQQVIFYDRPRHSFCSLTCILHDLPLVPSLADI